MQNPKWRQTKTKNKQTTAGNNRKPDGEPVQLRRVSFAISGVCSLNNVSESKDEIRESKDMKRHLESRKNRIQNHKQKGKSQRSQCEEDRRQQ